MNRLDVKALRKGAETKSTNTLKLLLLLYNKIADDNADDPRVENVALQIGIIEEELEGRKERGETLVGEKVNIDEDGKKNITIGLKPLNLKGDAKLK